MTNSSSMVRVTGLTRRYGGGDAEVLALDAVDVAFDRGRFTAVMGPSGSGKSTLLHCAAGLDRPDAGQVWIDDVEVTGLGEPALTHFRRDRVGFVFQSFNLVPTLTAAENITLPADLAGRDVPPQDLTSVAGAVGVLDRLDHRPSQLSGGQRQRVACARALVGRPDVVFADEPTGSLDSRASAGVLRLLRDSVDAAGQTVVMVTHDPVAAGYADRVVFLADGRVVEDMAEPTAAAVLTRLRAFDEQVVR
ncbi:ABC transporter ATP-binding protein [Saccharothrix yanglingensis]|uniref:Peptide ABC transporter ATP-binding protein n=1 Tax=Saccharothrix yanglingensis TaxID=659496 RepID=A0ABU0X5A2_9PSEU|nr:ABC transporter ATP-binding protein [Saccharothrix yanglingensis]MDQ2587321.1 peptide ABC transporter ATP-binding protein [Saccharothrix yanglingensis]